MSWPSPPPPGQPQPRPQRGPHAEFSGAWGDRATGGWYPARAVLSNAMVTLWVGSPAGWSPHFSVPAGQVIVKSAAQRITLVVNGRSYPILADPGAVNRGLAFNHMVLVGRVGGAPGAGVVNAARGVNQAAAAGAFFANGGTQFLSAMRASGARVSRLGYGALVGIGCGVSLVVVVLTLVITVLLLNA